MNDKLLSQHGVLINLLNKGVLITGRSGLGKSECAVELLNKGAFLVADDVVLIEKKDNIKRKPIFVETIFVKLAFMN